MTARLPNDKLDDHLRLSTQEMLYTQLESLVGKLNYECSVVDPGRTFLRHLINLLRRTKTHQTFIRLNKPSRLDLQWWNEFLPSWNGNTAFPISISPNGHRCPTLHSLPMRPVVKALALLILMSGLRHPGCPRNNTWVWLTRTSILSSILTYLGSFESVVHIITSGSSKYDIIMHLVRELWYASISAAHAYPW